MRELALVTLQMHGYKVLTAAEGKAALKVAQDYLAPIDMLLTDVVMPNLSGPELAKSIRARFPKTKVLFMSGYTDDEVVRTGLLQAEVAFIQKPFNPFGLIQKVRQVLDMKPGGCVWPP